MQEDKYNYYPEIITDVLHEHGLIIAEERNSFENFMREVHHEAEL